MNSKNSYPATNLIQQPLEVLSLLPDGGGVTLFRKCTCCGIEKELKFFYKPIKNRKNPRTKCKKCMDLTSSKYYNSNKSEISQWKKQHREENKEEINKKKKKHRDQNKEEINRNRRENRERYKPAEQKYKQENKQRLNKQSGEYIKNRSMIDPLFKLTITLRKRTASAFKCKSWRKGMGTEKLLGADYNIVKSHIESFFTEGMNWFNHGHSKGFWHIDHHIALATAKNEKELIALCHYTNLRPLWQLDNLSKGKKLNWKKDEN